MKAIKFIACADCGKACVRRGPMCRYCEPCSETRDVARKYKWAKLNPAQPLTKDQIAQKYSARRLRAVKLGAEASVLHRESIAWDAGDPVDLIWMKRVSVPFTYRLSKNSTWTTTRNGHVYLRRDAKLVRNALTLAIKTAVGTQQIYTNKLWIDIYVQKPNHKGDAVNVIDTVCDAIKTAIPLDDRWYSIRRLDWQVVKENPRLFVGIGQDAVGDFRICSLCGATLAIENFSKAAGNLLGRSRECSTCRKSIRRRPQKKHGEVQP